MKRAVLMSLAVVLCMGMSAKQKPVVTPQLQFDASRGEARVMTMPDGSKVGYTAYEGMLFVTNVEDSAYQTINVYVPDGATQQTPIFLRTYVGGYMASKAGQPQAGDATGRALKEGYVVAIPGARGRNSTITATKTDKRAGIKKGQTIYTGRAPKAILDLKAAIRYLRHFDKLMPGDAERIITDGTSAGGAMSSLMGATGNNPAYEPLLKEMGAADERDDVFASVCFCPITDLDHADMAYEWLYNGTDSRQQGNADVLAVSGELKSQFAAYINSLRLKTPDGTLLTADNYLDFIKREIIRSAQIAKNAGADIPDSIGFKSLTPSPSPRGEGSEYTQEGMFAARLSTSLSRRRGAGGEADYIVDLDMQKYLNYVVSTQPLKTAPAFDTKDVCGQQASGENEEFGDQTGSSVNFTEYSAAKTGSVLTDGIRENARLLNPMNFIGDEETDVAPHWYIRHGARDRDTSFPIPLNLALKLQNAGKDVNYLLAWNRPHSGDYALDELFEWIADITSDKNSDAGAVINNIMTRTSIRQYTDQPVSKTDIETLLRAGMAAPTAVNAQPWHFVAITDKAKLKELAATNRRGSMIEQAALAIVVCGNMDKAMKGKGQGYWIQDCSAATENILLAAHGLGLGAVWTGLYPMDDRVAAVSQVLKLPETIIPLCTIVIGHPAESPTPKDKWKPENVSYNEFGGNDYNAQADELCAKLITMDTHNHVDVPMITGDTPGPRVDLRTAMQKAGINALGMTFAVDYYYPLADGQSLERYWNAVESQDSILAWSNMQRTLNLQQLKENFVKGEPIVIQCVEGGHFLEGDISNMQKAYDRGLRVFCLLHDNDANQPLGDVYTNEPKFGGLTQLGADAIRECERLGILVDLAHCDSTTIAMALQVATKPLIISHTGLNTRLGSDDFMGQMMKARLISAPQAKMVADKGGVIGVWPHLASSPEEYASNIRAMVDIVGIDHVCIGTDSKITPDYMEFSPEHMAKMKEMEEKRKQEGDNGPKPNFPKKDPNAVNHEWNDQPDNFYHSIIRCLLAEGFNEEEIEKIVSSNFLRVFGEATVGK